MKNVLSVYETGGEGVISEVETHLSNGLPTLQLIGVAGKSLDESKERIRSAFSSSHIELPRKKITINITPADIAKDGSHFDVAIAFSILLASKQIKFQDKTIYIGELGLDGTIRPVRGVIGKILTAKKLGYSHFVIPKENFRQAELIPGIYLHSSSNLTELKKQHDYDSIDFIFTGQGANITPKDNVSAIDFSEIVGQEAAKRALEIAAAGHHNILLSGPPGVGKSMLAKALIGILPSLTRDEIITITHMHSLVSNNSSDLVVDRPLRSPHHSASDVSIIGGGQKPKPGEVSLSHNGILFLDELPEFKRSTIESLRQPLEDKVIHIARAKDSVSYPADFLLIATKNPCPCGYYGSSKPCVCTPIEIERYQKKLSGPLLDRIDIHVKVDSVDHRSLLANNSVIKTTSTTEVISKRVKTARSIQSKRFNNEIDLNGAMNNKQIKQLANLTNDAKELIDNAAQKLQLSARVYMKTVKLARTIADLDNSERIESKHISEALRYRPLPTT